METYNSDTPEWNPDLALPAPEESAETFEEEMAGPVNLQQIPNTATGGFDELKSGDNAEQPNPEPDFYNPLADGPGTEDNQDRPVDQKVLDDAQDVGLEAAVELLDMVQKEILTRYALETDRALFQMDEYEKEQIIKVCMPLMKAKGYKIDPQVIAMGTLAFIAINKVSFAHQRRKQNQKNRKAAQMTNHELKKNVVNAVATASERDAEKSTKVEPSATNPTERTRYEIFGDGTYRYNFIGGKWEYCRVDDKKMRREKVNLNDLKEVQKVIYKNKWDKFFNAYSNVDFVSEAWARSNGLNID